MAHFRHNSALWVELASRVHGEGALEIANFLPIPSFDSDEVERKDCFGATPKRPTARERRAPPHDPQFALALKCQTVLRMTTMNTLPLSRRKFAQLLGAGAAAALVRPEFSFAKQPEHAPAAGNVVRLSANENPYGPSPKALKAMTDSFGIACRYPDEHNNVLIDKLAKLNGVDRDQILLGDGSSEILKLCAEAFSGKEAGSLVAADPTFEAILEQAKVNGAEVVKVPLTSSTYAHDLPRMLSSAKAGLIYICNPNNPTASITPKDELRDFIAKTPPETMLLVDEAYFHFADSPDYESVIPLVNEYPNLLVARTFSKIYGMAGLRCGYCVAQKQTHRSHAFRVRCGTA